MSLRVVRAPDQAQSARHTLQACAPRREPRAEGSTHRSARAVVDRRRGGTEGGATLWKGVLPQFSASLPPRASNTAASSFTEAAAAGLWPPSRGRGALGAGTVGSTAGSADTDTEGLRPPSVGSFFLRPQHTPLVGCKARACERVAAVRAAVRRWARGRDGGGHVQTARVAPPWSAPTGTHQALHSVGALSGPTRHWLDSTLPQCPHGPLRLAGRLGWRAIGLDSAQRTPHSVT